MPPQCLRQIIKRDKKKLCLRLLETEKYRNAFYSEGWTRTTGVSASQMKFY